MENFTTSQDRMSRPKSDREIGSEFLGEMFIGFLIGVVSMIGFVHYFLGY